MRVAIVGCGYVGVAIARYWQTRSDYVITVTTTTPERVAELETIAQQVVVLKGDDEAGLRSLLQNQDAILLSVGAANASLYEETYLNTAKALVAALKDAPRVQQLVYTSSYALYGDKNGAWVDEESPIAPANLNNEILAQTEQVLLSASSPNLNVCILRLAGIYGPGRELVQILGRLAGTTQPGAGDNFSNWVHLEDIVGAIAFAFEHHLQGIYNLGNDTPMPRRQLIERLLEYHRLPSVTWDESAKSTRPHNVRLSNRKLKTAGYQFVYPETFVPLE